MIFVGGVCPIWYLFSPVPNVIIQLTFLSHICSGLLPMLYNMDKNPLWKVFLNIVEKLVRTDSKFQSEQPTSTLPCYIAIIVHVDSGSSSTSSNELLSPSLSSKTSACVGIPDIMGRSIAGRAWHCCCSDCNWYTSKYLRVRYGCRERELGDRTASWLQGRV
jgi:hypothetical protein